MQSCTGASSFPWSEIESLKRHKMCFNCKVEKAESTTGYAVCQKCNSRVKRRECKHCLEPIFCHHFILKAIEVANRDICLKCFKHVAKSEEAKLCTGCSCECAFGEFTRCDRCLSMEKKHGQPLQCEMCHNLGAFKREAAKKVNNMLLCFLCTKKFKSTTRSGSGQSAQCVSLPSSAPSAALATLPDPTASVTSPLSQRFDTALLASTGFIGSISGSLGERTPATPAGGCEECIRLRSIVLEKERELRENSEKLQEGSKQCNSLSEKIESLRKTISLMEASREADTTKWEHDLKKSTDAIEGERRRVNNLSTEIKTLECEKARIVRLHANEMTRVICSNQEERENFNARIAVLEKEKLRADRAAKKRKKALKQAQRDHATNLSELHARMATNFDYLKMELEKNRLNSSTQEMNPVAKNARGVSQETKSVTQAPPEPQAEENASDSVNRRTRACRRRSSNSELEDEMLIGTKRRKRHQPESVSKVGELNEPTASPSELLKCDKSSEGSDTSYTTLKMDKLKGEDTLKVKIEQESR